MSANGYNITYQPDMPPLRSRRADYVMRSGTPWERKPQVVADAHVKVFDMAVEEDLLAFQRVMGKAGCSPQAAVIHTLEKTFCADTGSWKVFVIWYDLFSEPPDETRTRMDAFLRGEECL